MDKERALVAQIERQDRLTGRVIRTWSHIEWELGELLSPLVPPPHDEFMRKLWTSGASFAAKCEMLMWLGESRLGGDMLEELRTIMAQVTEQNARVSAIAHDRVRRPYTAHSPAADLIEYENRSIRSWAAELDDLLADIQRWHVALQATQSEAAEAEAAEEEVSEIDYEMSQVAAE